MEWPAALREPTHSATDASPRAASREAPIVELVDVVKDYPLGKVWVHALDHVDLKIEHGEFTAIAGPSGSGKTTLLNLVGCVDVPTSGTVRVDGADTSRLAEAELTRIRLHTLGFIFQTFNLVPVLSVFQNVELPLLLRGDHSRKARARQVTELLGRVGIESYARQRPNALSGGQRQRVAIARALISKPHLVLADEPTANLDSRTGASIIELMRELNHEEGTTFLFSTHDSDVMARADRILRMVDGKIVGEDHPAGVR